MGKVIFWIVVVFGVLLVLRLYSAAAAKRRAREAGAAKGASPQVDTMVRCANCGVYLPRADALPTAGGYLCGDPGCSQRR
jgi:uncharacterized protein